MTRFIAFVAMFLVLLGCSSHDSGQRSFESPGEEIQKLQKGRKPAKKLPSSESEFRTPNYWHNYYWPENYF